MEKLVEREPRPVPQVCQKTILVVDDDRWVLQFMSRVLTQNHYTILTAASCEKAIELSKAHEGQIHLIVSEFQMGEMNGVDLAWEIAFQRPNIEVVLTAGCAGGLFVLDQRWHFLKKPFVASQLRNLVASLLSQPTFKSFSTVGNQRAQ
jgi:DNA-binding NtrC family response regulator